MDMWTVGNEFLGLGRDRPSRLVCSLWKTQAKENQQEFSPTAHGISACSDWRNTLDTTRSSQNQSPVGFQSSVVTEVCLSHHYGKSDLNKIKQGSLAIKFLGASNTLMIFDNLQREKQQMHRVPNIDQQPSSFLFNGASIRITIP